MAIDHCDSKEDDSYVQKLMGSCEIADLREKSRKYACQKKTFVIPWFQAKNNSKISYNLLINWQAYTCRLLAYN